MSTYTLVTVDNYHTIITDYIKSNEISITDYDDMKECILRMIKDLHCFNFDKNSLRGFMEDLTYMYNSTDEKNKDRIINMLDESDDDSDDDDDDDAPGSYGKYDANVNGWYDATTTTTRWRTRC